MSSVIKINAITVPVDSGDELAQRFAARHGSMDGTPGFQGYELLKPTDDRHVWLVLTRWDSEEDFVAWRTSQSFGAAHGERGGESDHSDGEKPKTPVGMSAELWSYTVATTG